MSETENETPWAEDPRGLLRAEFDGLRTTATVVVAGERRHVFGQGRAWQFAAVDPLHHSGEGGGAGDQRGQGEQHPVGRLGPEVLLHDQLAAVGDRL